MPISINSCRIIQGLRYQVLENYHRHLKDDYRLTLKVPQIITAQKIHRGDHYIENHGYLNPKIFTEL